MTDETVIPHDLAGLFRHNGADLRGYLRRRGFTAETAADITQDAFLRLLNQSPADRITSPRGYLFRIAANLGLDLRRREQREASLRHPDGHEIDIADDQPSVERILISRQELRILARAFAEVPPGPQQVFLARLDGLTFAEIERRHGVPLKTAFSQVMKVTLLLKSRLDAARAMPGEGAR